MFGSLVTFGFGGAAHVPARPADRPGRGQDDPRSRRSVPPTAALELADLLLRVSRLSEDLPEVTDLDLDLTGPDGVAVVNARVKVTPYEPKDPFLRKLR